MIRVDDFAIAVADVSGRWYYMGGIEKPYQMELFNKSMESVFPAVAIMGRMVVIMPHKVGDAFSKILVISLVSRSRGDLGGVAGADLQHPTWLRTNSGSSLKGVGKSEFGGGLAIAEGGSRLA